MSYCLLSDLWMKRKTLLLLFLFELLSELAGLNLLFLFFEASQVQPNSWIIVSVSKILYDSLPLQFERTEILFIHID